MTTKKVFVPPASLGGRARARALTKEQRTNIALSGSDARWGKDPPAIAEYGAPDRPLRIGSIDIPCYVLADGRRVLAQRGLLSGIGMSEGGGKGGERKLVNLLAYIEGKDINIGGLIARANSPIRFVPPHGGNPADGYEATILPDLCAVLIEAGRQGKLHKRLEHLATRCGILQHGFATVGIVALVDEATGYQDVRARDALAKILEKFVTKELRKWVSTFPADFYKEMFRLRGWSYSPLSLARPGVAAHYTNDIVYDRIAPGVREEIQRVIPRNEKGKPKGKYHQMLTEDVGHPKLKEHLVAVITLMKASSTWDGFMGLIDRALPRFGATRLLPMPLDGEL